MAAAGFAPAGGRADALYTNDFVNRALA